MKLRQACGAPSLPGILMPGSGAGRCRRPSQYGTRQDCGIGSLGRDPMPCPSANGFFNFRGHRRARRPGVKQSSGLPQQPFLQSAPVGASQSPAPRRAPAPGLRALRAIAGSMIDPAPLPGPRGPDRQSVGLSTALPPVGGPAAASVIGN